MQALAPISCNKKIYTIFVSDEVWARYPGGLAPVQQKNLPPGISSATQTELLLKPHRPSQIIQTTHRLPVSSVCDITGLLLI